MRTKYKKLSFLLIIVTSVGFFLSSSKNPLQNLEKNISECAECKNIFPEADTFSLKQNFDSVYEAYKKDSKTNKKIFLGFIFFTADFSSHIRGYGGPINIAVGLNPNKEITKIYILRHHETSSYLTKISFFLKQFEKKKITDSFILGKDIDAITQATITSQAITQSIKYSLEKIFGAQDPRSFITKNIIYHELIILIIIFILACSGFLFLNPFLKWLSLCVSLIYLGILKAHMFSIIQISNIGLLKFPSLDNGVLWFGLLALIFLTLISLGNIYCGSVCPFAAIQEIIRKISQKLNIPSIKLAKNVDQKARNIKYGILLGGLFLSFIVQNSDIINFEIFILLFTARASFLGWLFVAFIFFISFFNYRFWCKYLCPIGAFNGLLSRLSLFKIRANKKSCTACGICQNICPTQAIDKDFTINPSECILCGECLKNCPQQCLTLSIKKNEKS
ncbi:MAG TPA: 4Fe-4S binding protein [Candidatus Omnitrophota bacterium]|nr:4Fe-4S binding protein [Candidatus Omnitrophota bacterium]